MSKLINKTKTSKPSNKDKICAKNNKTYEITWVYTTNRSGNTEYLYTGKEQGKDYMDSSDKNIRAGDRVIYKNKNHQNNKVKAKVIEITSPLSKVEAAKKGVEAKKFAKIYKLKFLNPPIVNGKQIRTLSVNKPMLIEKIPHHKDYICLRKKDDLRSKIDNKMKKTFLTEKYYKSAKEKQLPFIIEKVLAKETSGKKVLDLNEMVEPTSNYIIQSVNLKSLGKAHKSKRYSNNINEFYRIKARIHIYLKDTSSTMNVSNISGFLSCDNHKQKIADIFNDWRNDSYTYVTNLIPKRKDGYRKLTSEERKKIRNKSRKISKREIMAKATRKAFRRQQMKRRGEKPLSVGQKALREKIQRVNKTYKKRKKSAKKIQKAYKKLQTRKAKAKKEQEKVERNQKIIDDVMEKRNESKREELEERLRKLREDI